MKNNFKLFAFILCLFAGLFIITGCGKDEETSNSKETTKKEVKKEESKTIINDKYITIKYLKREYKKIPGMMNNENTVFNLPTILVNITNNTDEEIRLGVHTSKKVDNSINYAFNFTNSDGVLDTTGTTIPAKSNLNVNIIYQKIRDIEKEYPLDSFDNKTIYLELYKNNYNNIKSYDLDGNELK